MSQNLQILNQKIEAKHLLKHPFYQAWSAGQLSIEDLQFYARQYFAHVRAFPTYLSEMHSRCTNLDHRRMIAQNLADEEATRPTHPELWLDFAAGLGVSPESVLSATPGPRMSALIETYRSLARQETPLAAAALYCYEKQIPAVAHAKIEGLTNNYGIEAPETLRYFDVHRSADVEHAAEWEAILTREDVPAAAIAEAADQALNALWAALDEIHEQCGSAVAC